MTVEWTPRDYTVETTREEVLAITAERLQVLDDYVRDNSEDYDGTDWSGTEEITGPPNWDAVAANRLETGLATVVAALNLKAEASDLSSYVTLASLQDTHLPGYVTQTDFTNTLDAYATEEWVTGQALAPRVWVTEQIANAVTGGALDLSDYATQDWVTNQGYITGVPASYATRDWVTGTALLDNATRGWVTGLGYLTQVAADDLYLGPSDLDDYATAADTQTWVNGRGFYVTPEGQTVATQSWVQSQGYGTGTGGQTAQQVLDAISGFTGTIATDTAPATGAYFTATHTNQLSPIGTNTLLVGPLTTNEVRFGTTNLRFFNGTTYDTAEQFVRRHESDPYEPVASDINPIIAAYRGVLGGTDSRHNIFGALGDFNDIAVAQVLGRTNSDSSADNLVIGGTSLPTNIYNLTTAASTSRKARWHWRHAQWNVTDLEFINDAGEVIANPFTTDNGAFDASSVPTLIPVADAALGRLAGGGMEAALWVVNARTVNVAGNINPTGGGSQIGTSLLDYFESAHIKHIHFPTGGTINFQTASDVPWATQSYVDTQISGVEGGTFTGGEITDDITFDDNNVRIGQTDGVGNRAMDVVSTNLSIRNLRPYETSDGNAGLQFRYNYNGYTNKVYIKARNQTDEAHEVIFDVRNFRFLNSEVGADLPWLPSTTTIPAAYGDSDVATYLSNNNYQPGSTSYDDGDVEDYLRETDFIIRPNASGTIDLGEPERRFQDFYTAFAHLSRLHYLGSNGQTSGSIELHSHLEIQDGVNITRPDDASGARPLLFTHANPGGIGHLEALTLHGPSATQNGILDVDEIRNAGNSTTSKIGDTADYFNEGFITNLYSTTVQTATLRGGNVGPTITWGAANNIGATGAGNSFDNVYADAVHAFGTSRFAGIAPPTTGTKLLTIAPQASDENLNLGGSQGTQTVVGQWRRGSNNYLSGYRIKVWEYTIATDFIVDTQTDMDDVGTWTSGWSRSVMTADRGIRKVILRADRLDSNNRVMTGDEITIFVGDFANGLADWAGHESQFFAPADNDTLADDQVRDFVKFTLNWQNGIWRWNDPVPAGHIFKIYVEYL